MVSKDLGLVTQVFDEASLSALTGEVAVGHVRYSTNGGGSWEASQPHISAIDDVLIALAHNGTLVNTNSLRARMIEEGVQLRVGTDSEVAAKAIGRVTQETHHLRSGIKRAMEMIEGAYAMVLVSPDSLYAFRDPNGIRPLCFGELPDGRGWVVASETCGLDIVGASYVRDVAPGEIVRFGAGGMSCEQALEPRKSAACIFEYVYFARPDSMLDGQSVYQARRNMGRILAGQFAFTDCARLEPGITQLTHEMEARAHPGLIGGACGQGHESAHPQRGVVGQPGEKSGDLLW